MINDSLSIGLVAGLVSILVGIPVFFVLAMLAERNSARRVADHAYHRLERYIDRRVRWALYHPEEARELLNARAMARFDALCGLRTGEGVDLDEHLVGAINRVVDEERRSR
jgi:hypothetical protein